MSTYERERMKKTIFSCIGLVLLFAILLGLAQALLVPKYMTASREGALIGEYYAEADQSHDVIFLGDCEVYESFTPPTLYEEYGITSYIRGSAQQLVWQSYYLLEEMLKYETPKAVVFNVLALKYGEPQKEAYNRMTLDGMRLSASKLRAIRASMTEEESVISYLVPLLRYHSRWQEVGEEDWRYLFRRDTVSHNGYLMQTGIKGGRSSIVGSPLADPTLPHTAMEYLEKMRLLCEQNGVELILIKAPTNDWKYYWYDEWEAQIKAYAAEHALAYYNFIPLCDEIGLDWSTDTYDAGVHLNVYGAEKLTRYFGRILAEEHGLQSHKGESEMDRIWTEKLNAYYAERNRVQ